MLLLLLLPPLPPSSSLPASACPATPHSVAHTHTSRPTSGTLPRAPPTLVSSAASAAAASTTASPCVAAAVHTRLRVGHGLVPELPDGDAGGQVAGRRRGGRQRGGRGGESSDRGRWGPMLASCP